MGVFYEKISMDIWTCVDAEKCKTTGLLMKHNPVDV